MDRLEAAGFVRRERDAEDRRRVIVHLVPDRARKVAKLFEPLARAMAAITLDHIATVARGRAARDRR